MPAPSINLHVCALAELFDKTSKDFPQRRDYARYKKERLQQHLQRQLAVLCHCDVAAIQLGRSQLGKPLLLAPTPSATTHSAFVFNYSHSQSFYALASSSACTAIGVDIEDRQRKIRHRDIADYAFHPQEIARWQASGCNSDYWLAIWTVKEALVKAAGIGIRINLADIDCGLQFKEKTGSCQNPTLGEFHYQIFQQQDFIGAVAWAGESELQLEWR